MDFELFSTPQAPNCMFCPLVDSCTALSKGLADATSGEAA